jgi:hypothetical protein
MDPDLILKKLVKVRPVYSIRLTISYSKIVTQKLALKKTKSEKSGE